MTIKTNLKSLHEFKFVNIFRYRTKQGVNFKATFNAILDIIGKFLF
ncbi:MAG: hypothetical protein IKI43_05260 [Campylobacter sp.]|nr:hypothetical protein [Campylobacter sp.]MBR7047751.1 hypothetical protein [Campylobacter sp.]